MPHVEEGQVHAYLDGECTAAERAALELHIQECVPCSILMEESAATKSLATQLVGELAPDVEAPAWQALLDRVDEGVDDGPEERTVPMPRPQRAWRRQLAWAATLVLAFTLGWHSSQGFAPNRSNLTGEVRLVEPVGGGPNDQSAADPVASSSAAPPPVEGPAASSSSAPPSVEPRESPQRSLRAAKASPVPALDEAAAQQPTARELAADGSVDDDAAAAPPAPRSAVAQPAAAAAERLRRRARSEEVTTREALVGAAVAELEQDRAVASVRQEAPPAPPAAAAAGVAPPPTETESALLRRDFRVADKMASIDALAAEEWLGAAPLRLVGATEIDVSVGPGGGLPDAFSGRPMLRHRYVLDDGAEITLLQQHVEMVDAELADLDAEEQVAERQQLAAAGRRGVRDGSGLERAVFSVHPSGERMLRWRDRRGYLVWLRGLAEEAHLRRLAGALRR